MTLSYLPAQHIPAVFESLGMKATTPMLIRLVAYIFLYWIELWSPKKLSVFGQAVRTNNDVEWWHGMHNRHAKGGNLSFYLLVRLLHKQAKLVQAKHASRAFDQKLKRGNGSNTDKRHKGSCSLLVNRIATLLGRLRQRCAHLVSQH